MCQQVDELVQEGPGRAEGVDLGASQRLKVTEGQQSRFGAAAHLLDRLDTRPLDLRHRPRSWWRFW